MELTSPSTARTDKVRKKAIYEGTFRTPDYFIYDPFDANSLQGWHLGADQRYHSLERNERGWLWCETLGYWLGTWEGTIDRETAIWARFYDPEGNLIPLPEEAAQEQAAQPRSKRPRHRSKRPRHRSKRPRHRSKRRQPRSKRRQPRSKRRSPGASGRSPGAIKCYSASSGSGKTAFSTAGSSFAGNGDRAIV